MRMGQRDKEKNKETAKVSDTSNIENNAEQMDPFEK